MWARMSGPGKNRVGTNVRGNECPYTSFKLYCWKYLYDFLFNFLNFFISTMTLDMWLHCSTTWNGGFTTSIVIQYHYPWHVVACTLQNNLKRGIHHFHSHTVLLPLTYCCLYTATQLEAGGSPLPYVIQYHYPWHIVACTLQHNLKRGIHHFHKSYSTITLDMLLLVHCSITWSGRFTTSISHTVLLPLTYCCLYTAA